MASLVFLVFETKETNTTFQMGSFGVRCTVLANLSFEDLHNLYFTVYILNKTTKLHGLFSVLFFHG